MSETLRLLIEVALVPAAADQSRLLAALTQLAAADRAFGFSYDADTGQTILKCADEVQLEDKVERLRRDFRLSFEAGAPQVAYRERLTRAVEVDCTHSRPVDPAGEFAQVRMRFEPLPEGSDLVFANADAGASVSLEYVPGIERGVEAASQIGVVAGFPLIEFKATLVRGAYRDIDSSEHAFEIATRGAFRELRRQDAVELVEPVMDVEMTVPARVADAVIASLGKRRMRRMQRHMNGGRETLRAIVPLANLLGYAEALDARSEGRATFVMTFRAYEPVPRGPDDNPLVSAAAALKA